ncbi:F-box domain-containing protein [Favolaschia claudopus]|uniref:F-box domain-containing protein n=1 Tax=Favolaschia claudopus TaxID=2862362 RepID=A0AAW0DVM2_9AGAR
MSQSSEVSTSPLNSTAVSRLPAELLVEIFGLCWKGFEPHFGDIKSPTGREDSEESQPSLTTATFETEITRVAHAPLLIVSRVCTAWRAVAVGTPSLWCEIELDTVLFDTSRHIQTATQLLALQLARSGDSLITVDLTELGSDDPFPESVLDILMNNMARCRSLACSMPSFNALCPNPEQLRRLHSLWIHTAVGDEESLEPLALLPHLSCLTTPGRRLVDNLECLPIGNLERSHSRPTLAQEMPKVLAFARNLPRGALFHLELWLFGDPQLWTVLAFQPTIAAIGILYIKFSHEFELLEAQIALGTIITHLTLPNLQRFEVESQNYPRLPVIWPHPEFLALSARSDFHAHLRELEIYEVQLTETQLLECLSELHALERLAISDHQLVDDGGVDQLLITDGLFSKLSYAPGSLCLVPRLSSLGFQTLLRFDDNALLALAVSRLQECDELKNGGVFGIELSWLPGSERKIDEVVLQKIHDLKISTRRRFTFDLAEAESMWVS